MPFDMYGDVILTRDVTEHALRAGDVGTVVERHAVPGVPEEGYSVEFYDMTGNTVTVVFAQRRATNGRVELADFTFSITP